jgi:leucyl/phenylalanyl-tRNA---protein transferase
LPVYWLDERLAFPDPQFADSTGLLAVGGDLKPQRLILAYQNGIFPWFDEAESPILWHAPHERFVITPETFRFGRSIRKLVNRHTLQLTYNRAFDLVLDGCAGVSRADQDGTWLGTQMKSAYKVLHERGYAHSAEAYDKGSLVGGLYGVGIGKVFFGESMFSLKPGVSKVIFAQLVPKLFEVGYRLIDCQIHTDHLERFGAKLITSSSFLAHLSHYTRGVDNIPFPD